MPDLHSRLDPTLGLCPRTEACSSHRTKRESLRGVGAPAVEVGGVDGEVERTTATGFGISSALGRHTNDKMVSYYLRAPGGWDIVYGYDGLMVDENQYLPQNITADSYWGDDWSGSEPLACIIPLEEPVVDAVADSLSEPVVETV